MNDRTHSATTSLRGTESERRAQSTCVSTQLRVGEEWKLDSTGDRR